MAFVGRSVGTALVSAALLGGSLTAHADWTFTVLHASTSTEFARATVVHGNRQAGTADDGYSRPLFWTGSAASETPMAEPSLNSGPYIEAMSANAIIGTGYVSTSPTSGFYGVFVWNQDGSQVTVIPPPLGYFEANGYGGTDTQQVGSVNGDSGSHPALWSGTAASFVNLLPAGAEGGAANAADGNQQGGYVDLQGESFAALWTGTAASFVNLHPTTGGWTSSEVYGMSGGRQVGRVSSNGPSRACAWNGTAASFVSLHPTSIPMLVGSRARGISQGVACGSAYDTNFVDRALVWTGLSPTQVVDLSTFLPGAYLSSEAYGVWTDGSTIRVVGSAYNGVSEREDAVMWTFTPSIGACCSGLTCVVVSQTACAAAFIGSGTTCGPETCCEAPVNSPLAAGDCDGDLLLEACSPPNAASDCNNNGQYDTCETLVFTNSSFSEIPAVYSVNGSASIDSASTATLTPALMSQGGSVVRPPLTSGATQRLRAIFDFRISDAGSAPGDGFSFSLFDATLYTTAVVFSEDGPPGPGTVAVKFNTFDNGGGEGSNSMYVLFNGGIVGGATSLPFTLADGQWHRAVVDLTPDGRVTVRVATNPGDMTTVFNNLQIPGYVPFRANIGFGARTGAAFARHSIANVRLGVNGPNDADGDGVPDACDCPADFNLSGTVSVQDIFDFLAAYFANDARADFNQSGALSVQDLFDFLAAYFAGC